MGKTTRSPRKLRKKLLGGDGSDGSGLLVREDFYDGENKVMMVSYRTPKSKLKSALKTTKKARYNNRYQKRVKDDDEDEENHRHHRMLAPSSSSSPPKNNNAVVVPLERQTLVRPQGGVVNFDENVDDDDEEASSVGWHFDILDDESSEKKKKKKSQKSLVKRPPPTPSTPFHFARDFFENGCDSEMEHTTTVSSECGGFKFDLEERKEKSKSGTTAYLAGQRDAYKDALLHDSLPLQKLVERQKQNVDVLERKQEKMEAEVKEQTVLNAVLFERTNAEKVQAAKMEKIGAKLCASVEKLEREVIVLKSAEKEKQNATKMRLFMEKCVGFGAFLLGRETRSVMLESPISKKLFEEEFDAETPAGPSTPPKRERTSEELATSIALCVALEAIATLEASRFVPLRAPLPVRLGMYLSRVYLWSRVLGVGHRDLTSATRNTVQLIVLASRLPSEYHREREEDQTKQHRILLAKNERAPSDAGNAASLAVLEKMAWLFCR